MTEYTRDDMARAWQQGHVKACKFPSPPDSPNPCHVNPYAAPALHPEPPEGTIVVDRNGDAWQKCDIWFCGIEERNTWGELVDEFGPLRVAVPLTDEERTLVSRSLNQWAYNTSQKSLYVDLRALADRIEGTQP